MEPAAWQAELPEAASAYDCLHVNVPKYKSCNTRDTFTMIRYPETDLLEGSEHKQNESTKIISIK